MQFRPVKICRRENVKNIVGAPFATMIAFKSSLTLNQYAQLPMTFATYLESFNIKVDELLLQAISCNSSTVR
jgi:hypothetical protein